MKRLFLLCFLCLTAQADSTEGNSYYVLPFAAYTPDTRVVLGGSMLALVRTLRDSPDVPISTVSLSFTGTQNRQYQVGLSPDVFTSNGDWEFRPFLGAQLYPSSFVGIGTNLKGPSETYTSRSFNGNFYVQKRIAGFWRLGPFLEYQTYRNEDRAPGGKLAGEAIAGAAGTTFSGLGLNLEWDDLDNRQFPTGGTHFGLSAIHFDRRLGTTDPHQRLVADFKHFVQVFPGHVLAGQIFSRTVFGTPPFQALSNPGGGLLRGADGTRALDRSVISVQLEYRFPLFWRLRGDVFGGLAEVAPRFQLLPVGNTIPAGGAGLRWVLDRESKINVRFDYAWSSIGDGFYAAIGESF